jgi:Tfp pilus assembly protein PilF
MLVWSSFSSPVPALDAQASSSSSELAMDLQRGQAALKAKDPATAVLQFRAALKLDPSNVEAHANLGVIAFFRGDCKAAEEDFHDALQTAPSLTKAQA